MIKTRCNMYYYDEVPDDVLDKHYAKNSPYINPYYEIDRYDELEYEDDYDYFQESEDDDKRKGVW